MEGRTGLVIGGMSTVAASVAVVCAVALTNSIALADSPGSSVASARVLVPAAESPAAAPAVQSVAEIPQAEVVQPPAPVVVDDQGAPPAAPQATPTPAPPAAPPAPSAPQTAQAAIAASQQTGTWDAVRSWALAQGWPAERIDAWIARLQEQRAAANQSDSDRDRRSQDAGEWASQPGTSDAERRHGSDAEVAPAQPSPERPAHAGSNADRKEHSSGVGSKKDRSRDSPDRRDR